MSLQLTNNEWQLKLETEIDSLSGKYLLGNFSNPFVILNFVAIDSNPVWTKAGYISQAVLIDDSLAYAPNQEVLLNINNFRSFDSLSGQDYQLYYFPPARLEKIKIKVWEYQGIVTNSLIADIALFLSQSDSLFSTEAAGNINSIEKSVNQLLRSNFSSKLPANQTNSFYLDFNFV